MELQFAPMTAPTRAMLQDQAGAWHEAPIALDLVSNHTRIRIPGNYLVDGHYYLPIEAINAGGSHVYRVPVTISHVLVTPIPSPVPHPLPPVAPGPHPPIRPR